MPSNPPIPAPAADPPNTLWGTFERYNTHNQVGSSSGGGVAEAPTDGKTYGRINSTWAQVFDTSGGLWINGQSAYFNSPAAPVTAQIIAYAAQNPRWAFQIMNGEPETGSSTGSNLQFARYTDGNYSPIACAKFIRATGVLSLHNGLNLQPTTNASPQDGDLWYDGTHLNFRHGSTTTVLV